MYAVTSSERGKTHTILSCVSASGYVLPPMMVYPRKKSVPENFREGAVLNTLFANSDSGWMNTDLFLHWFKFFFIVKIVHIASPLHTYYAGRFSIVGSYYTCMSSTRLKQLSIIIVVPSHILVHT